MSVYAAVRALLFNVSSVFFSGSCFFSPACGYDRPVRGDVYKRQARLVDVGNRHVTDGSLDFGQRKDVLHQLRQFGACEIFELRGKALNRAAQIAKTVGCLLYTSRCV